MGANNEKLAKAKERLRNLKGFYTHLTVYLVVNTILTIGSISGRMEDGHPFLETLDLGPFVVWFFWGIGLFFHGLRTFRHNLIFSKQWEERQIQKYIEKDKKEAEKFR